MLNNIRRHKRVPFASIATVSFNDAGTVRAVEAFTADISMSGIGLYSETALEMDRDVSLSIEFPGNIGLSDAIRGYVIYNNRLGIKYFTGIEFREQITPLEQPFLYERLRRILGWE